MTPERLEYYVELIKTSSSLCEVCRKAGIVATTGNYKTLKKIISDEDIDVSHFKRQGGKQLAKPLEDYLVTGGTISSYKLKNKLFKYGLKEKKCEECGLTEWMGKPINLELHHKNGDPRDNRLENLEIMCPNCHSYTDTYSGKNQKLNIKPVPEKKGVKTKTKPEKRRHGKLNDLTLERLVMDFKELKSFRQVGIKNGVSDNAIRKWCHKNGIPTLKREFENFLKRFDE